MNFMHQFCSKYSDMVYLLIIILDSFLTQLQNSFSSLTPAGLEVIKVISVSFAWIGGLTYFMWWKDKHKAQPATH